MVDILEVDEVSQAFGGIRALNNISFRVREGEIKSVIGPNGAGKTTLFNVLTGVTPTQSGTITFDGERIETLPAHRRVGKGMARTFQNLQIFGEMSVLDNVVVGRHVRTRSGFVGGILNSGLTRLERRQSREHALDLLRLLGMEHRAGVVAASLSYGEAKILEIARAMAAEPKLLLLDEPMAGLPGDAIKLVSEVILSLNKRGVSFLLVEHNVKVVMGLSHSVLVMSNGTYVAEGCPQEVRANQAVIDAYLGEGLDHAA